jgi:hypothetical protein
MRSIGLKDECSMRVFLLDGWNLFKHVSVNHSQCDVVFPITDIVFKVHRVRVGLHEYIVLSHCLIDSLTFTAVYHQDYQIARQPLFDLLNLVISEKVFGPDIGVYVEFGDVVEVGAFSILLALTLAFPFFWLRHWRPFIRVFVYLKEEIDLLIGQFFNSLVLLICLFFL